MPLQTTTSQTQLLSTASRGRGFPSTGTGSTKWNPGAEWSLQALPWVGEANGSSKVFWTRSHKILHRTSSDDIGKGRTLPRADVTQNWCVCLGFHRFGCTNASLHRHNSTPRLLLCASQSWPRPTSGSDVKPVDVDDCDISRKLCFPCAVTQAVPASNGSTSRRRPQAKCTAITRCDPIETETLVGLGRLPIICATLIFVHSSASMGRGHLVFKPSITTYIPGRPSTCRN